MNPVLALLTSAKFLIADPLHWTQKAFARDAAGRAIDGRDPAAVCLCASTALWRASDVSTAEGAKIASRARKLLGKAMRGDIFDFNDEHDHEAVMRAFDRAMAKA